jgi:transcriptional regulator with PAS, ATPase and Fis domain
MVEVYNFISRVASNDSTVLLRGETGTGKELVAQLIHKFSARAKGRMVVVDCAAIPASLLESELFGAVRGAYTGADRDRTGLLETAHGGTVLLDEVGEVDPGFQLRLLRFLQEKEVRPVGASVSKKVDVRVIAATNKNLDQERAAGRFRDDLWYRLSVAYLELPPLRERREDIPLLAERFLEEFQQRYERRVRLGEDGLKLLLNYSWPGNVRQLRHLLERLVIVSSAAVLDGAQVRGVLPAEGGHSVAASSSPVESLDEVEEEQIRKVLSATGGNKTKAAEILGIERKTLYRKLSRMEGA